MNEVKRVGVFETNSSSSHSISIVAGSYIPDRLPIDSEGKVEIYTGEFGWEPETYNDAVTKAAYCLTYVTNHHNIEKNHYMLREVIREATGAKEVRLNNTDPGYIDHQSDDVCMDAFVSHQTLRDFIFNKKSVLTIDNDNH